MFFSLRTLLARPLGRLNDTGRFPEILVTTIIKEALRAEFGDSVKTFPVVVKKTRNDEIRIIIKNPLIAGEVFLHQDKLLRRINAELGRVNRTVKRVHISS